MRPAVFLDRDGVLCDLVYDHVDGQPESALRAADVRLAHGAREGVAQLRAAGFALIGVSNQPSAAKGKATLSELCAVHERVVALLLPERLDDWRYCWHRSEDGCRCRKPAPGMLLDAAADHDIDLAASWMVGDADTDAEAGRAAGTRTALIAHPGSVHRRRGDADAADLEAAARLIIAAMRD